MTLLKGFHLHHILPLHAGGTDAPENLVLLHPADHAIAHLVRWKLYGDVRDKWASNWLLGIRDADVYTEYSKARELRIAEKRKLDPAYDAMIHKKRSDAAAKRAGGYQKEAGANFTARMITDLVFAQRIRANRSRAAHISHVNRKASGYKLVHSDKTKELMSEQRRGEKHPLFGKSPSSETIEKIRFKNLGKIPVNKGVKSSEETKLKQRDIWSDRKYIRALSDGRRAYLAEVKHVTLS